MERQTNPEPLQEMLICKLHQSLLYTTPEGLVCVTGGEDIVSEDQITRTIGRFVPFDQGPTGEEVLESLDWGLRRVNHWVQAPDQNITWENE